MGNIKKHILIIAFFFGNIISVFSQNIDLEKQITIVAKQKTLEFILNEIQQKTDVKFSYNTQSINTKQKLSIVARKKSVKEIFKILFSDLNIEYIAVEKQIVLKKKIVVPENEEIIENDKTKTYTISGYVKNETDGEVIIGAGITINNTYLGTITNEYGFYSLTLPSGKYFLNYSHIGFNDTIIEINLNADKNISTNLEISVSEIEIVIVTEHNNRSVFEKNSLKKNQLTNQMITANIGLAGEADVVKSIQSIPGITSYGDGSVLFYVRGGAKDENLIMIDDAPIYNPSHLFGFFSAIAPDAVNDMNVYKNTFPVKYGGRLSSVIVINTKDGNSEKWGFSGKISPFTGNYTVDGPIKEKTTLLFNVRNAHINWLLKKSNSEIDFYDFHFKFKSKLNHKNRLFCSVYKGKDFMKIYIPTFGSAGLSWENNALSLRWNHLYSDKLFSNMTLHASKYDYFLYYSLEDNKYWNSFIGNISLKNDFTYFVNPKNQINFGLNINSYFFNPGNLNNNFFGRSVYSSDVLENVLYLGHDKNFNEKINLSYGVRLLNWKNFGPTTVFSFDENFQVSDTTDYPQGEFNKYLNTELQISFVYAFSNSFIAKISYDKHIQNLQLLSNSISPFTTMDVWMPAGLNIKPEKSNQLVAGISKQFTEIEFTSEIYYKTIMNLIDYDEHANMLLNPYIEGELRVGTGYSFGLEFALQKTKGNFNFYSAYTYSRTFAEIKEINDGRKFPSRHDKPHNININLSYKTDKKWTLSLNWIFSSGMRFSSPTGFYYYKGYNVPIYGEKNNDKLPAYHRLDVSATLKLNRKETSKYKHELTFSVFNCYGRNNFISVNFNKIESPYGKFYVPTNMISEKEFIPTSKYLLGFLPSISYSFKFR